jgi:hypothetical protein
LAGRWLGRAEDFFALRTAIMERWPLTPSARNIMATSATLGSARAQCIPYGPPEVLIEPVLTTIVVGDETVELTTDMDGVPVRRVIHLELAEHPRGLQSSRDGHSIGRWEEGVLVVDTIGFSSHPEGFGFGLPSSERKHLVERFSLSPDRRQLVYETRIEDPDVLTGVVTVSARLDFRPDLEPNYSGCDLEAARRYQQGRTREQSSSGQR